MKKRSGKKHDQFDAVLMLRIFNGCIETGTIPGKNSPCQKRLLSILDDFKPKKKPHQKQES